MSVRFDLSGYGPADVAAALREGRRLEFVQRFVLGNECRTGPTESFDADCAEALVQRLLELVEDGAL